RGRTRARGRWSHRDSGLPGADPSPRSGTAPRARQTAWVTLRARPAGRARASRRAGPWRPRSARRRSEPRVVRSSAGDDLGLALCRVELEPAAVPEVARDELVGPVGGGRVDQLGQLGGADLRRAEPMEQPG